MSNIQAYEIDMRDYIVPGTEHLIRTDENEQIVYKNGKDGDPETGALYPMKRNVLDIFMSFPVTGRAIIEHRKLGDKINDFNGDKLYLGDKEYKALVVPFEEYQFRPAVDGIMSERIFDAKKVDMEPAGKKK